MSDTHWTTYYWCPRRETYVMEEELKKRPLFQMDLFDPDKRSPEERYSDFLREWMAAG